MRPCAACSGWPKKSSTLIYYDTVWQPLDVRLGRAGEVSATQLQTRSEARGVRLIRVHDPGLTDARRQNIAVLAQMDRRGLMEGVATGHYRQAMQDLMAGGMLEKNLALFERNRCKR